MDYLPAMRMIKMTNEGIFFDEEECIAYTKTNLPKGHFKFKARIQIYWLVALNPIPGNKTAKEVHVENYQPKNIYTFADQFKLRTIPFLQFTKLDRDAFLNVCESYDLPWLECFFSNPSKPAAIQSVGPFVPNPINLPVVQEYSVELTANFADATIVDGAIVFQNRMDGVDSILVFEIPNPSLNADYEIIKEYIVKKLGRKTFRVTATIKKTGHKAVVENACSEDIARIDDSFIQKIKDKQNRSLLNIKPPDGKFLHTLDELLLLSVELKGNVFQANVENIIQTLTGDNRCRNAMQLNYLAKQHDITEVVYLTTSPCFGFVFYLQEDDHRSYVWELLNSHATYIWSFEGEVRDREREFEHIEQSINEIREVGRNQYKHKYHRGETIADCRFNTIQHAVNGQSDNRCFDEWLIEFKSKIKR